MDDSKIKEIEKILWINGLKNAVEFEGNPNKKAIMGKLMGKRKDLRPYAKEIMPILDKIVEKISKLELEEQRKKLLKLDPDAFKEEETQEEKKELPELPNVNNYEKVIMRLAPYPSGALHIGNARMVVLNDQYTKRYNGKLILFFDDTIGSSKLLREQEPEKAKYVLPEAYDLIKEGLEWLGVKYSKVYYKSDRLQYYYKYCKQLIEDNMAYVCSCSAEEFKEKYIKHKKQCPHRNHTVEKNLEEWEKMLNREYHETEAIVRLKTGMDHKDPALRDQIIMRISEASHPRVYTRYTVWPMLEFSWAIDDYLIGVTHILRGTDLIKEDYIEDFIWTHFKWKKAQFLHYGRINFPNMKLSKTNTRNKILKGEYDGWDDPRTWSLQSLKKRGILPEALRETLLDLGMSMSGITFSVNWLYAKNQALIDESSHRYFFVENPIKLIIDDVPFEKLIAEPLLLPTNPGKGRRKIECNINNNQLIVYIAEADAKERKSNDLIRLKDLFNIKIISINSSQNLIKSQYHSKELNREFPIIHWVPNDGKIHVKILKPDGFISEGYGEHNLLEIPMKKTIQFERYGFVNPIRKDLKKEELFCYFTH